MAYAMPYIMACVILKLQTRYVTYTNKQYLNFNLFYNAYLDFFFFFSPQVNQPIRYSLKFQP